MKEWMKKIWNIFLRSIIVAGGTIALGGILYLVFFGLEKLSKIVMSLLCQAWKLVCTNWQITIVIAVLVAMTWILVEAIHKWWKSRRKK